MAVVLYWKERLAARCPIRAPGLLVEGFGYRKRQDRPDDPWFKSVARQTLLLDYQAWFTEVYLPPFASVQYYQDFPDQLPVAADDLAFFTTIAPFIYIVGKKQQTRSYLVDKREPYQGRWIEIKSYRNFVRLCEWEDHVAAFRLQTGQEVTATTPVHYDSITRVAGAVKIATKRIAANKEAMDKQMGKR
jgi:hypothetical protein